MVFFYSFEHPIKSKAFPYFLQIYRALNLFETLE